LEKQINEKIQKTKIRMKSFMIINGAGRGKKPNTEKKTRRITKKKKKIKIKS